MRIGITGARGYLGSHLTTWLGARDNEVIQFSRSNGFRLDRPPKLNEFAGLDALIHTAYDFRARGRKEIDRLNVQGTVAVFEAARVAGVSKQIVISSMAAFEGCRSIYGQSKLRVEAHVLRLGGYIVRPATIFGGKAGGICRQLLTMTSFLPIIPLPSRGQQMLYLVHIDDLAVLIQQLLKTPLPESERLLYAANTCPVTLRAFLTKMINDAGRRRVFLPVPPALILTGLRAAEAILGPRWPLRSDSFLSLVSPNPNPHLAWPPSLADCKFREFSPF